LEVGKARKRLTGTDAEDLVQKDKPDESHHFRNDVYSRRYARHFTRKEGREEKVLKRRRIFKKECEKTAGRSKRGGESSAREKSPRIVNKNN